MAIPRTSLSAGIVIYDILANDADITSRVTKVFPVVEDEAELPYVAYKRSRMEQQPVKQGAGADMATVEVLCFGRTYQESVDLAELVRAALDGRQHTAGGLTMRSCTMTDSDETWEDDAYVQQLTFTIKVSAI